MKHKEYKFNGRKIINTIIKYFGGGIEKINKHIAQLIVKTDESLDGSGSGGGNTKFVRVNNLLEVIPKENISYIKEYRDLYPDSSKLLYLYELENVDDEYVIYVKEDINILDIVNIDVSSGPIEDIDDTVSYIVNNIGNLDYIYVIQDINIFEGFCFFYNDILYCAVINMPVVDYDLKIPITKGLYIKK